MALSGIEMALVSQTAKTRAKEKINVISYADDFVVTAASQEILENKVIPILKAFLQERGLELSQEKTKITRIEEGFNFLGFNVRKYFTHYKDRNWQFHCFIKTKGGQDKTLYLKNAADMHIRRHRKIRA